MARLGPAGVIWLIVLAVSAGLIPVQAASADVVIPNNLVIRTVQAIGASSNASSHEIIEIHNPTVDVVDVTNWSLTYSSASGNTTTSLVRITPSAPTERVLIGVGESETFMTEAAIPAPIQRAGLMTFLPTMNHAGGSLSLRASDGSVVDRVGWGTAVAAIAETNPAPAMAVSMTLQRLGADTDNNLADFVLIHQSQLEAFSYGNLYEITDACSNMAGNQTEVPEGFIADNGECKEVFVPALLRLSEVLPNPNGSDSGKEFIEVYNDSDYDVAMTDYYLKSGSKIYHFPSGAVIPAKSYMAWSDVEIGLTLANTVGVAIELVATNDSVLDTMPAYQNAAIDYSWAWLDTSWMYTNRPTMGSANLALLMPDDDEDPIESDTGVTCKSGYYFYAPTGRCRKVPAATSPTPCKDGQYRSEETGRCRNIALSGGTLNPCKEGQYRSEETNRCRSLVSAVSAALKPCRDDQFRNPETGRCKKIASADDMPKPCPEGQERNPATNRCRKIRDIDMPLAGFPVQPVAPSAQSTAMWWVLAGVVTLLAGYGAWEWRNELGLVARKLAVVTRLKK